MLNGGKVCGRKGSLVRLPLVATYLNIHLMSMAEELERAH